MNDDNDVAEWADMNKEQRLRLWADLEDELRKFEPVVESMLKEIILRNFKAPIRVTTRFHLSVEDNREDPRLG